MQQSLTRLFVRSRSSAQQMSTWSTRKLSPLATIPSMLETTASTYTASATKLGLRARRRSASMCTGLCMCLRARRRVIRWNLKVRVLHPYVRCLRLSPRNTSLEILVLVWRKQTSNMARGTIRLRRKAC